MSSVEKHVDNVIAAARALGTDKLLEVIREFAAKEMVACVATSKPGRKPAAQEPRAGKYKRMAKTSSRSRR